MSNILVTGGAGAIGSNLVKELLTRGDNVIVLDDISSGNLANLDGVLDDIVLVQGDIRSQSVVDEAFSHNIDKVYHLAVNFANQNSVDNPEKDLDVNGRGIIKILDASVKNNIEKFLLTSSSCVYKPGNDRFVEDGEIQLTTPYAITKLLSEHYVKFFSDFHNLSVVSVRLFNSYGPGDVPGRFRSVVPNFLNSAVNGEPLKITGDGSETRPFTYVLDIVNGIRLAMDNSPNDNDGDLVYNIGTDNSITILELAEKINDIAGNKAGIELTPRRDWDMFPNRAVNNDKARKELGFEIKYDIDTGLKLNYDWFKKQDF